MILTTILRIRKALWCAGTAAALVLAALAGTSGTAGAAPAAPSPLPCNIYAATGTPCVAAYSTVRALYRSYRGPLYQVTRASDGAKIYQVTRASDGAKTDIGLLKRGGYGLD